jgi:Ca2+-binding EF-hand superfamily protein
MGFSIESLEVRLSPEHSAKVDAVFKEADKDGSGALDSKEVANLLPKLGLSPTPKVVKTIITLADLDGNSILSLGEFRALFYTLMCAKGAFAKECTAGKLSGAATHELLTSTMAYDFTRAQSAQLLQLVDNDGSRDLDVSEFMVLAVFLRAVRIQFMLADTDGDGSLSRAEITAHLPSLGVVVSEAVAHQLFDKLDSNKNGSLDFGEFALLVAMLKLDSK